MYFPSHMRADIVDYGLNSILNETHAQQQSVYDTPNNETKHMRYYVIAEFVDLSKYLIL